MTEKQIIINGVDVSGCKLFRNGICVSPINSKCKLCVEISKKMCYYKQLKGKEQECEELRTDIKDIANLLDLDTGEEYNFGNIELEIKELKQQLDQLKAENEKLEQTLIEIKKICENNDELQGDFNLVDCDKYKLGKHNLANKILQKISECEVENEK